MEKEDSLLALNNFARELVAASKQDLDISSCHGCARCSSVCKVAIFGGLTEAMTPRSLLYRAIIGEPEELIRSNFIWMCSGCRRCEENCPQHVPISEVVRALRRLAQERGVENPVAARVNERACMHCGSCVRTCPNSAVSLVEGGHRGLVARVDASECRGCGACSSVCPNGAIQQALLNYLEVLDNIAGGPAR